MTQNGEQNSSTTVDVGGQRVAKVYAEALLNAAQKQGRAQETLEELESLIQDIFRTAGQFEAFLASGAIGRNRKAEVLQKAFANRGSEIFVNFLLVLSNHERLDLLRPIARAYKELYDRRAGRMRVEVRSAVPLPEDQRNRLQQELRETFHREPMLESKIDPDLLGGLVVRVGDWLYDASIRTQLETIRNQIIARSSHEIQSGRDRFSSPDRD
jgi:F-type H+-transporting ATPase subunit delta